VLLRLIARALGVEPPQRTPATAAWDELAALAADPRSGLALKGKPPV